MFWWCAAETFDTQCLPAQPNFADCLARPPANLTRERAGAYGCTISGAGPTAVAVVPDREVGAKVAEAMGAAFRAAGLEVNSRQIVALDPEGAKFM